MGGVALGSSDYSPMPLPPQIWPYPLEDSREKNGFFSKPPDSQLGNPVVNVVEFMYWDSEKTIENDRNGMGDPVGLMGHRTPLKSDDQIAIP